MSGERLNVYQYCVIDAQGELHHGLAVAESRRQLLEDVDGNYGDYCRYVGFHQLYGVVPEIENGQWTGRVGVPMAGVLDA